MEDIQKMPWKTDKYLIKLSNVVIGSLLEQEMANCILLCDTWPLYTY